VAAASGARPRFVISNTRPLWPSLGEFKAGFKPAEYPSAPESTSLENLILQEEFVLYSFVLDDFSAIACLRKGNRGDDIKVYRISDIRGIFSA
jgi:hypothetical protein